MLEAFTLIRKERFHEDVGLSLFFEFKLSLKAYARAFEEVSGIGIMDMWVGGWGNSLGSKSYLGC